MSEGALVRIGDSTAAAVAETLAAYCPEVIPHKATVPPEDADPAAGVGMPGVVAEVSYVDGVTGGNLFLMPLPGARALAAVMMGAEPPTPEEAAAGGGELDELALSAVGEAANQMMAAAAGAMATVLGQEVDIGAPQVRVVRSTSAALDHVDTSASVVSVRIDVLGHTCRLIQIVPHGFIVRMTRALDNREAEAAGASEDETVASREGMLRPDVLGEVRLRVSAEVGRATMTIRRAVTLAPGAVVELDRALEDPIDLYVNGRRFATGQLVTLDDDELAIAIETVATEVAYPEGDE